MSAPIKTFNLGKCSGAVFENDYKGKKSYSFKFQKSYQDSNKKWVNTDFFYATDLRDLYALIGYLLDKQVKERVPQNQQPTQNYSPQDMAKDLGGEVATDKTDGDVPF